MKKRIVLLFMITGIMITGCGAKEPNTMQEAPVQEIVSEEKVQEVEKEEEKGEIEEKEEKEEVQETAQETERNLFAEFEDLEFYFASGAWRTIMHVGEDGSFWGQFSDSEMGSIVDGYPNGTYYVSDFEGKFGKPVMVNDYTYSMEIEEIHYQKEVGAEEIIDGILYCYSGIAFDFSTVTI